LVFAHPQITEANFVTLLIALIIISYKSTCSISHFQHHSGEALNNELHMIDLTFKRPVGAAADAKELEYVTALHQTREEMDNAFVDGSIEAKDVKFYLISRYGIVMSTKDIQRMVFQDLAGGGEDTDCIDICELVAMLLIPFFAKLVKGDLSSTSLVNDPSMIDRAFENESQLNAYLEDITEINNAFTKSSIVKLVLNNILLDSFDSTEPQPINTETVRAILTACGEPRLLEDEELIEDMVLDLSGGDPNAVLDVESFSRALSNDVMLYDVKKELSLSTYFADVFGENGQVEGSNIQEAVQTTEDEVDGTTGDTPAQSQSEADPLTNVGNNSSTTSTSADDPENVAEKKNIAAIKNTFTCSQIDFLADGCRSKEHLALAYAIFVIFIFRYQSGYSPDGLCNGSGMGCAIAKKTTSWVIIMSITM